MKQLKHVGKKKLGLRRRTVRRLELKTQLLVQVQGGFHGLEKCTRKYSGCNGNPRE